jgi:hypothetical protein
MAIDRLLALDMRDRFASCDVALRALASFAEGEAGSLRLAGIVEAALPRPRPPPPALSRPGGTESAPKLDPEREEHGRGRGTSEGDPSRHGPSRERSDVSRIGGPADEDPSAIASGDERKKR